MPVSIWLSAAEVAVRAASLNLCTDEYLLLLARPEQVVSVSHLGRNRNESVLWQRAARYPANRGSLESALAARPNLLLTMGGGGRSTATIARRLGIRHLALPYPSSIADVRRQAVTVAAALGDARRAQPFLREIDALSRTSPARPVDAAFMGNNGTSLSPDSLGAEWLRLAGYRQRALPGGRLTLEAMAANPPTRLVRSDYRGSQWSRGNAWLAHPIVTRLRSRTLTTDGRAWTCAGLPMIGEIRRLREARR